MSAAEIIAQLPRLSEAERDAVRDRLDELAMAAPLSAEEKRLVDARLATYRQNPDSVVSWAVAEAEARRQTGL